MVCSHGNTYGYQIARGVTFFNVVNAQFEIWNIDMTVVFLIYYFRIWYPSVVVANYRPFFLQANSYVSDIFAFRTSCQSMQNYTNLLVFSFSDPVNADLPPINCLQSLPLHWHFWNLPDFGEVSQLQNWHWKVEGRTEIQQFVQFLN